LVQEVDCQEALQKLQGHSTAILQSGICDNFKEAPFQNQVVKH